MDYRYCSQLNKRGARERPREVAGELMPCHEIVVISNGLHDPLFPDRVQRIVGLAIGQPGDELLWVFPTS